MSIFQHWKQQFFNWLPENNRLERIWLLAKSDFLFRYYGSYLGLFWALLNPLFQLLLYFVVFTTVFNSKTDSFLLFLFLGIICFQFFSEVAAKSTKVFKSKSYLLGNIYIDKIDLFIASLGSVLMGFVFNFGIYLIFNLVLAPNITIAFLWLPFLFLNLILFIFGVQLILGTIGIYLKDIEAIWSIIQKILFWSSGIFFDITTLGAKAQLLLYLNPIAGIITNLRRVLIYGQSIDGLLFFVNMGTSVIFVSIGIFFFRKHSTYALELL